MLQEPPKEVSCHPDSCCGSSARYIEVALLHLLTVISQRLNFLCHSLQGKYEAHAAYLPVLSMLFRPVSRQKDMPLKS